ncbi:MAG: AraC family transcriptional regulator [Devosia sp.]
MIPATTSVMFGSRLGSLVGMRAAPATLERPVRGRLFAATRLVAPPNISGPIRFAKERAYVLSVQLSPVRRRDLWVEGKRVEQTQLPAGSVSFYDLEAEIDSQVHSGFDSLQFYLSRDALDEYARETGSSASLDLTIGVPIDDGTIRHLAHSMLPTLESPTARDTPFVEEMALALLAHAVRAYGTTGNAIIRGGLAPWQQKRAQDMLTADLTSDVSLIEVAAECGLSVSHFARAFRQGVGKSPHRWLVDQRIERAKVLLADPDTRLAEIAVDCGFSDQSHFTRMFARDTGWPPGAWRRLSRD